MALDNAQFDLKTLFGDKAQAYSDAKEVMDTLVPSKNEQFRKTAKDYKNYIGTNTGTTGANTGYNWGKTKGEDLTKNAYQSGLTNGADLQNKAATYGKKESSGLANYLTAIQSGGAASQALGNAVSSGMTRGRAALDSGNVAAQAFSNNYANNYNTQLAQQNAMMNAYTGNVGNQQAQYTNNFNNQQNVANQQLANQINTTGTLMGANLTNDQSEYQQGLRNLDKGVAAGFVKHDPNEQNKSQSITNTTPSYPSYGQTTDDTKTKKSTSQTQQGTPEKGDTWTITKTENGGTVRKKVGSQESALKSTGNTSADMAREQGMRANGQTVPTKTVEAPKTTEGPDLGNTTANYYRDMGTKYANKVQSEQSQSSEQKKEDATSDYRLKNSIRVGLKNSDDPRMVHYRSCSEKLGCLNPNKWNDLIWRAK